MNKKAIISAVIIWIPLIIIWLLIPVAQKQHNITVLQNNIVDLEIEKGLYSWMIAELWAKHDACSTDQEQRHDDANAYRTEQDILNNQINWIEHELLQLVWLETNIWNSEQLLEEWKLLWCNKQNA